MTTTDAVDADATEEATRVVLSYPADLEPHGKKRLRQSHYKKYLRKSKDTVAVGDEWREFTDIGCCGSQMHLTLNVEEVEGGSRMGLDTDIEYSEREACGLENAWNHQYDDPDPVQEP